ncbi:MAG: 4-amino-4-deoxy-L-arabinose-phosphoundecaprenol flippase subunit ArnE [bacterium ADurb.Bin431]|nr:MAG: 4-amino-4-deoxy-L-arabinose-phosphoundecaprenol flippase subunit ArnE [bacterium ADurb.Bin431]HNY90167.1 DMT family transporter [bacterium]HOH06341.1 DMT family transporter [bacterium]
MNKKLWLVYALVTTLFWGVWGALIELPEKAGFPATLGYVVWALTMLVPVLVAMNNIGWKVEFDRRSVWLGSAAGFLGAGGQLILFQALRSGPAYLVFPFISLSPVLTILMSYLMLKERASKRGWAGILLAMVAMPLLSYQPANSPIQGGLWIVLALLVFLAWGIQAFVIKFANETMKAESIFFYMTVTGLLLIPFALWMTDFSQPINWGLKGPWLAAAIQILNAIGALTLVYAFRHGKALIVSPLTNAVAPVITIILSLTLYRVIPHPLIITGMVMAMAAVFLMAIEEGTEEPKGVEK